MISPNALAAALGLLLGVPLNGVESLWGIEIIILAFPMGWLHIHVVAKMVMLPTKNVSTT